MRDSSEETTSYSPHAIPPPPPSHSYIILQMPNAAPHCFSLELLSSAPLSPSLPSSTAGSAPAPPLPHHPFAPSNSHPNQSIIGLRPLIASQ